MFNTELTPTAARDRPMKNSARPKVGAWLNRNIRSAVDHVDNRNGPLVACEAQASGRCGARRWLRRSGRCRRIPR